MTMRFLKLGLLLLVLACLGACSSSNNLSDPGGSSTTVETSCDATKAGCVEAQFVADEIVTGLGFTCSNSDNSITVTSVTDANGFFYCPSNAVATFYIGNASSANQVILGTATVSPLALPSTVAGGSSGIVTITPVDIAKARSVGSGASLSDQGTVSDPISTNDTVLNITRFLKAIDDDGNTWRSAGFSADNPSNEIVIDSTVTEQVAKLSASIPSTDFTGTDLPPDVNSFIDSIPGKDHSVDVPSAQVAQQAIVTSQRALWAGVYGVQGLACSESISEGESAYDQGMCANVGASSVGANSPRSGNLELFVDRSGYGLGFGMTSTSSTVSVNPTSFYLEGLQSVSTNSGGTVLGAPDPTIPVGRPFNYINNQFILTGASTPSSGSPIPMRWTGIFNGGVITSTATQYDQLFGAELTTDDANFLGKWQYDNSSNAGDYLGNGQFFLYNSKPANPFLSSSITSGLTFPINLTLTFEYPESTSASTQSCPSGFSGPDAGYCLLNTVLPDGTKPANGTLQISILRNGNIITNLNQDCNQILDTTTATPVDSSGYSEYRIGYVSTATTGVMASDSSDTTVNQLSLTMMFPANSNANLPASLKSVLAGITGSALFLLPVSGPNSMTVKLADNIAWNNFIAISPVQTSASAVANATPNSAAGYVLVSPANNVDPKTKIACPTGIGS